MTVNSARAAAVTVNELFSLVLLFVCYLSVHRQRALTGKTSQKEFHRQGKFNIAAAAKFCVGDDFVGSSIFRQPVCHGDAPPPMKAADDRYHILVDVIIHALPVLQPQFKPRSVLVHHSLLRPATPPSAGFSTKACPSMLKNRRRAKCGATTRRKMPK